MILGQDSSQNIQIFHYQKWNQFDYLFYFGMTTRLKEGEKIKYQIIKLPCELTTPMDITRKTSVGLSSHKSNNKPHTTFIPQHQLALTKSQKKVRFQPCLTDMGKRTSTISLSSPANNHSITTIQKPINQDASKNYKSLNSSFIGHRPTQQQKQKSNRSLKTGNPQLGEVKKISEEIVKKIDIFFESQFTQKQIIEWMEQYCQRQRNILLRIFVKHICIGHHKTVLQKIEKSIERDEENIQNKLEVKIRDSFIGTERFITSEEVAQFNHYLENLYLEKTKVKMKEFQRNIVDKMEKICQKVRREENNEFMLTRRKKPIQICHFLRDIQEFQENYGSLKKITSINRLRFKMLNDTDKLIDKQIKKINDGQQTTAKAIQG